MHSRRFSFDRETGDLYIGDAGQDTWEEVDVEPRGTGHRNYGWSITEGAHCRPFGPEGCDMTGLTPPVDEYGHGEGLSVIGGYVYRGRSIPSLRGFYVHGDWGSRQIRAFTWDGAGRCGDRTLILSARDGIEPPDNIHSFGEDAEGELYVVTETSVYRMTIPIRTDAAMPTHVRPDRLKRAHASAMQAHAWAACASARARTPAPGVHGARAAMTRSRAAAARRSQRIPRARSQSWAESRSSSPIRNAVRSTR